MFDIGFSELLLFGIIALIVLGPEKLPKAARTAGQWYAKIRRTVSTLQSEIEAELDLVETRQQMEQEIAKIRQTEAEMRREMAEMRGSIKEFEYTQSQSIYTKAQPELANDSKPNHHMPSHSKQESPEPFAPAEFNYAYEQDQSHEQYQGMNESIESIYSADNHSTCSYNTDSNATISAKADSIAAVQPMITRPWENMWFRLGAYDKARRLPSAPYLPNYKADTLLNDAAMNTQGTAE
ncbi:Sec-independent protein translocase protein TatB [Psychrobacter urativorans]|uniref:Sec-independent protein translocase protein TatB n=1 Tax=Psychrobacter urativorans TaxID=45610 RepID=A0A0M4SXE7_9GAMM|nr:Sec-independent protein translocase protein TatB [Psychrobacter urativorans]ALF59585.1 preprotein translocase subunit TatB [Psychrobacter urativorans]